MKYAGDKEGVMNGGGQPPRLLEQVRVAVRGASLQPVHGTSTKGDGSNLASD